MRSCRDPADSGTAPPRRVRGRGVLIDGGGGGTQRGSGVGAMPWLSTLALVTRKRRVGVWYSWPGWVATLEKWQCGIARSVVWNLAVTAERETVPPKCV